MMLWQAPDPKGLTILKRQKGDKKGRKESGGKERLAKNRGYSSWTDGPIQTKLYDDRTAPVVIPNTSGVSSPWWLQATHRITHPSNFSPQEGKRIWRCLSLLSFK